MSELEILKKELKDLEKQSNDLISKSEKINNIITKKKKVFNDNWLKNNPIPLKIGDIVSEGDEGFLHKITKFNYTENKIYISTLLIVYDVLDDFQIKTSSINIFWFCDFWDNWEQAFKDAEIKIFNEKNNKTQILDLVFNLNKEPLEVF